MLSCQELVELVTDYLEGALPAHREREVHDHLLDCADCLRYLGQIQLTTRLLARMPSPNFSDEDNEALAAALRAVLQEPPRPNDRPSLRRNDGPPG